MWSSYPISSGALPGVVLSYSKADVSVALAYDHRFDVALVVKDVAVTIAKLRALPQHTGKVGTVGYCMGGKLTMLTAARTDVDCAVCYYGVGIDAHLDELATARCPMVFHFAENDSFSPPILREKAQAELGKHPRIEQYVYPGCAHAFAAPGREGFDKPAMMMAYSRTMALLRKVLGPATT